MKDESEVVSLPKSDVQSDCVIKDEIKDDHKNEVKEETNDVKEVTNDVYSYTRSALFTSETHKIEIKNLPKHIGYDVSLKQLFFSLVFIRYFRQTFKKLFKKLELKPLKTKLIGKHGAPTHSFVTFRCDEDRDEAILKLDNYLWKNTNLIVRKANPIPDPLVEKRNETKSDVKKDIKRFKTEEPLLTDEEMSDKLNDKIAGFWKMDYKQQKEQKLKSINNFLTTLRREVVKKRQLFQS